MSLVTLRLPMPLREFAGGAAEVEIQARTVGEALTRVGAAHAALVSRILTPEGAIRRHVNVFAGERNVRDLEGLDTPVREGDVLTVIPAVAGG